MTAPTTTDAPTTAPTATGGGTTTGGGADGGGPAPTATTSNTSTGTGTGTAAGTGKPHPTERVQAAEAADSAPRTATGTKPAQAAGTATGSSDDDGGDAGDDGGGRKTGGEWRVEDLPPGAQKLIADLRKESATRRTEAGEAKKAADAAAAKATGYEEKFATAVEGLTRALGLTPEPDEPERSPEERIADLTDSYRQARIELAVYRAAHGAGGDPDALLDSRGFLTKAYGLDPAADGFDQAIATAIGEAVTANPKLRAPEVTPVVPAAPSGGDFGGGPADRTGPENWTVDDFRRAREKGTRP